MSSLLSLFSLFSLFSISFLFINNIVYGINNSEDDICDYVESCSSSPCDCDVSSDILNCNTCNDGTGCSQCDNSNDYFRVDYNSKCVSCENIFGCLHCVDGDIISQPGSAGCQQCDTSIGCNNEPVINSCNIKVCQGCDGMNTGDDTTTKPSMTPSNEPTMLPTINLGDAIEALRDGFDDFWTGVDGSDITQFFSNDALVCWGGVGCGDTNMIAQFTGLCNIDSISLLSDTVFQDNRVVYSFYRACLHSDLGLFWINGMGITKYNQYTGKIDEFTVNFRDLDILLTYFDAFLALQ